MRQLATITNNTTGNTIQSHTLALPQCCPKSRNPFPGSTITITYKPVGKSLEVARLYAYLDQFKGGLRDDEGDLLVRDMEGMIERIAQDCVEVLHVPVIVSAHLHLKPTQEMDVTVEAEYQEVR